MEAVKIADNPQLVEDDSYKAVQNNGKIWLFREKYEDQSEYHHGHRTLIAGSSVTTFDIHTEKWESEIHDLAALVDSDQSCKLDELIFTFSGAIFLILFNRFEGLQIKSLWKFDESKLEWKKQSEINEIIEKATGDNTFGSNLLMVRGDQGPYIVAKIRTSEQSSLALLKLTIGEKSTIEVVHRIDELFSILPAFDPLPLGAIHINDKIYVTMAERGCGYRWRTEDVLRFELKEDKIDAVQIKSENPNFGLLMATENHYKKETDTWMFFGSLSKIGGMHLSSTDQTPETRFYVISGLSSSDPVWKESDLVIIDPDRDDIYIPTFDSVYIISRKLGTLKAPYGSFHQIKSRNDEL